MKQIRLGVVFDQQIRVGGGYQQALNAALLTKELPADLAEVVFFTTLRQNISSLAEYGITAKCINISFLVRIRALFRRNIRHLMVLNFVKIIEKLNPIEKPFLNEGIDLIYFLSPSDWARDLEQINYITTVWDLCHRDDPEFPEIRWNRRFEARETSYRSILPRATAILVDSPLGKANIIHRYGVDAGRVHVMPFEAAVATRECKAVKPIVLNIYKKYHLTVPYVFYPAQFWSHKNHTYLLEGLKRLEDQFDLCVGAIFSGQDLGNLAYVQDYAAKLGLAKRVRFAGFVASEELLELYRQSLALVMPTYFGPTNLPPLEAFELGVPVLYSDKAGLRDQVGDAALLMDLKDPGSMAQHLANLIKNDQLREWLIQKGRERLLELGKINRIDILTSLINDFYWRRLSWQ